MQWTKVSGGLWYSKCEPTYVVRWKQPAVSVYRKVHDDFPLIQIAHTELKITTETELLCWCDQIIEAELSDEL